jgi:putative phage-type endonuclease
MTIINAESEHEIPLTVYPNREQWLIGRRLGIGASESPALFGLSPSGWHSPFSIWLEKTGLVPPVELEGEWLEWGMLLEEPIAQRYALRTERRIWQAGQFASAVHPRLPFMRATPDRWVIEAADRDGRGVLQIKNAGWFKADDWEYGPPDYIQAQVQHELAVTGFGWGSIAVLIGGNTFKYYDVERNDAYIAELELACGAFWDLVLQRKKPEIDGSGATSAAIKRLHPLDDGSAVQLDDSIMETWTALQATKADLKMAKAEEDRLGNIIREAIGPATFAGLPDGRLLSYKHQTTPSYTVADNTYRVLREVNTKPKVKSGTGWQWNQKRKGAGAA